MAIYCTLCGANIALVGRVHRCIPRADAQRIIDDAIADVNTPVNPVNAVSPVNAPSPKISADATTDHNRAADERRAYMREYMRKRRAAARARRVG